MIKVLGVLVALCGILFLVSGLRWLIDPTGAAAVLGMTLLEGVGRSSQIGDMAAFFLTVGLLVLTGLITTKRVWFYPAVLLLSLAAVSRVVAWLFHDAALAIQLIAMEVVIAGLLLFASIRLGEKG